MTKQIEVITSVERRQRWSRADKERIVASAMEPGAVASEVARAAGIEPSQLFRCQQLCGRTQAPATSNSAAIAPAPASPVTPDQAGTIEIELATGGRKRITGPVDARTVAALMKALSKGKRRR